MRQDQTRVCACVCMRVLFEPTRGALSGGHGEGRFASSRVGPLHLLGRRWRPWDAVARHGLGQHIVLLPLLLLLGLRTCVCVHARMHACKVHPLCQRESVHACMRAWPLSLTVSMQSAPVISSSPSLSCHIPREIHQSSAHLELVLVVIVLKLLAPVVRHGVAELSGKRLWSLWCWCWSSCLLDRKAA
jgi:hypothetical protein